MRVLRAETGVGGIRTIKREKCGKTGRNWGKWRNGEKRGEIVVKEGKWRKRGEIVGKRGEMGKTGEMWENGE
jgi:hypothetical protein